MRRDLPSSIRVYGAKFGRKMEAAVAALLTHRNIEEAAQAVGVAPKTLVRWQQIPEFRAALRKARRDAYCNSIGRLQQGSAAAVSTLLKVMVDPSTPASTKVRAAESVLNHSEKAIELEDIESRLAELERSADQNKPGWRKP
jgi:hypothetical protein